MMKKRFLTLVLTCFIATTCIVTAKAYSPGDIIGNIYSTDIVAYIDGMAIPSYNIGGKTVVSEFDLVRYGFSVEWHEDTRGLVIQSEAKPTQAPDANISIDTPGIITGNIYYTDIVVWLNGNMIDAYNIGGQTMIALEDMGKTIKGSHYPNYNEEIGYSNYGFKTLWNESQRTVHLESLRPGVLIDTKYGTYSIVDTIITYWTSAALYNSMNLVTLFNNRSEAYVIADDFFDLLDISYYFYDELLTIEFYGEKNMNFERLGTKKNISNAILPYVEISTEININGNITKDNILGIVYQGNIYLSVDDLSNILLLL